MSKKALRHAPRRQPIAPRQDSRFTFPLFCRIVWEMSERKTFHYADFKRTFAVELETLFKAQGGGVV